MQIDIATSTVCFAWKEKRKEKRTFVSNNITDVIGSDLISILGYRWGRGIFIPSYAMDYMIWSYRCDSALRYD